MAKLGKPGKWWSLYPSQFRKELPTDEIGGISWQEIEDPAVMEEKAAVVLMLVLMLPEKKEGRDA